MELDESAFLPGFDSTAVARDLGKLKLEDELVQSSFIQTADDHPKDTEEFQTTNQQIKRKESQEYLFPATMQISRTDQPDDKEVFFPRLAISSQRTSPDNKSRDGKRQLLRLPEIRIIPSNISMLAFNRSITDLHDPEVEILNKIKHESRKKKRKRRKKTVQQSESSGL